MDNTPTVPAKPLSRAERFASDPSFGGHGRPDLTEPDAVEPGAVKQEAPTQEAGIIDPAQKQAQDQQVKQQETVKEEPVKEDAQAETTPEAKLDEPEVEPGAQTTPEEETK